MSIRKSSDVNPPRIRFRLNDIDNIVEHFKWYATITTGVESKKMNAFPKDPIYVSPARLYLGHVLHRYLPVCYADSFANQGKHNEALHAPWPLWRLYK